MTLDVPSPVTLAEISAASIANKVEQGTRIDVEDARWLWQNASVPELQRLAALVRARFHAPGECTYMVMRIINYTNVCVAQCDYCAFYKLPTQAGGYVMSHEEVFAKLDELIVLGGDLARAEAYLRPTFERVWRRLAHPSLYAQGSIRFSTLSAEQPYLGGIALALDGITALDSSSVLP